MGTNGTTHIKKGSKTIDFTDSYDGYFSAMGLNNLLSIKYISDTVMNKLVDSFTDLEYKYHDDFTLSQRTVQDALYEMEKDLKKNSDAIDWAKNSFSDEIRPSITGFGPILYLGINPSYNDSSSPDYIIDLDNREFVSLNHSAQFKISFDTIRNSSEILLKYFSENIGGDFELIESSKYKALECEYYELEDKKYNKALNKKETDRLKALLLEVQKEVDSVFKITPDKLKKHVKEQEILMKQKELKMQEYLAQKSEENKELNDEGGGFSIHSCKNISMPQLRKIILYVQKYIEMHPEALFLEETAEWGVNEDGKYGGFRIFSPICQSQDEIYQEVLNTIQYQFKIGMNIFSSSGTYKVGEQAVNEDNLGLFSENIPGPQQALFSLNKIRQTMPDWEGIIADADPSLGYHVYYKDAREVALSTQIAHENYSIPWIYMALLNQDNDVFKAIYPSAQKVYQSLPEDSKKMVASSILQSIADGEQINSLLGLKNNSEFVILLKDCGLFDDVKPYMNKREKALYFTTEKIKKRKLK